MGFWGQRAGGKSPGRGHPLHMYHPDSLFLDQVRHENSDGQAQAPGGP